MSENRKCISTLDMEKVSAILLDIAGTTTAISFVKETLYSYLTKNVEEFSKSSWENDDVKKAVEQFEEKDLDATKAAELVKNLTEKDDSNMGSKTIQGLLSKKGYESGDSKGHVYDDLPKFLEAWSSTKKFAVFSSGSVQSQQLLFENSTAGNLISHIKKFFDSSIGSKTDSETYKTIAKELEVAPADILYLTDDVEEAEAAKSADMNVVLMEREGNAPISEEAKAHFAVVQSFADISVENMKRKIVEVEGSNEEPPTKMAKIEENEGIIESAQEDVPNEKKDIEVGVEAMEVDQEPIATEKVEGEKAAAEDLVIEAKEATPEENEVQEKSVQMSEESKAEEQPAAMEVDSKTDVNIKEQTIKSETEIGTQTKPAVTNECETQTTISLAAADDLPIKKVEGILMSSEGAAEVEKKEEHTTTKEADSKVAEIEKKEVEKTDTEVTENKIEEQKENDTEKNQEVLPETEVKKTDTEGKEDKIEEQKDDTEKSNQVLLDIKSDSMATEENKENIKVTEENNKEVNKDNGEAVNGDSCEKIDETKPAQNGVAEDKETPKGCEEISKEGEETSKKVEEPTKESEATPKEGGETSEDKKESVENNGAEEGVLAEANGVKDETVEERNEDTLANGKGSEVPNGEAIESTNGTKELNEEEIKVKKIGNNVESAAVSVEA